MTEIKPLLLVVEDDPDVGEMLASYFTNQGYAIQVVSCGEQALPACSVELPKLVILDIRLPDIDGYEVARRLRSNRRTRDVPIIFLTDQHSRANRLQGLEIGGDDYVTKPFDIQELRLRVRSALKRTVPGTLTHPITHLPQGQLVEERLAECLASESWMISLVGLENLDIFREAYGFVASDDVLRAVSIIIKHAVQDIGGPHDFVGQWSPACFILITSRECGVQICDRVNRRLGNSLDYFYPQQDRQKVENESAKLGVKLSQLTWDQGQFASLDQLKEKLLASI